MEPNKDVLRKWVEKLRDPNSKQRQNTLGDTDGRRCCLGVLCDIAVAEGVIEPPVERKNALHGNVLEYAGETSFLPTAVQQWLGTEYDSPLLADAHGYHNSAIYYNDRIGLDFNAIADAIERTYLSDEEEGTEE